MSLRNIYYTLVNSIVGSLLISTAFLLFSFLVIISKHIELISTVVLVVIFLFLFIFKPYGPVFNRILLISLLSYLFLILISFLINCVVVFASDRGGDDDAEAIFRATASQLRADGGLDIFDWYYSDIDRDLSDLIDLYNQNIAALADENVVEVVGRVCDRINLDLFNILYVVKSAVVVQYAEQGLNADQIVATLTDTRHPFNVYNFVPNFNKLIPGLRHQRYLTLLEEEAARVVERTVSGAHAELSQDIDDFNRIVDARARDIVVRREAGIAIWDARNELFAEIQRDRAAAARDAEAR